MTRCGRFLMPRTSLMTPRVNPATYRATRGTPQRRHDYSVRCAIPRRVEGATRPASVTGLAFGRCNALTSQRYNVILDTMTDLKRATVYFDPSLHRALRVKSAQTEQSVSDLVNTAVRQSLAEDADDLAAFDARVNEPNLAFEDILRDLKRRGKL